MAALQARPSLSRIVDFADNRDEIDDRDSWRGLLFFVGIDCI